MEDPFPWWLIGTHRSVQAVTFPLGEMPDAIRHQETGFVRGKVDAFGR
jgi:hypothetical protein